MHAPVDHAPAMRRKRWTILILALAISAIGLVIYSERLGGWGIALGWVALIVSIPIAAATLTCPGCGKRLGGLFQTACAQCGVLLTDKVIMLPAQHSTVDPVAAEYMEASRRILARWASIRRVLRWGVPLTGIATVVIFMVMARDEDWVGTLGVALFVGVAATAAAWLLLRHIADNLFGALFMLLRGRCPLCRAWFTAPTTPGLGSIETDFATLPQFCESCGAKLA
jgi:hypothetical protein